MPTLTISFALTVLLTCPQVSQQARDSDINQRDEDGFSQLHRAAIGGRETVVEQLIRQGADVDVQHQKFQGTPLQYAAARGHLGTIQQLLKNGATVDSKDSFQRTPLAWAVDKKQVDAAKVLLQAGADVFTERRGWSVLRRLKSGDDAKLLKAFNQFFSKQSRSVWLRWKTAEFDFEAPRDGPEPGGVQVQMWSSAKPGLAIPEQASPKDIQGRFDVWLSDGIPKAVSSFVVRSNGKLCRSFALLRNEKVEVSLGGKFIWQPANLNTPWKPVPGGTAVAASIDEEDERTGQMLALAKRFTMPGRTLTLNPITRYENDRDGYKVIDGGVFAFLRNGIPEGIVCVEARRGKSAGWYYTVARFTAPPGSIFLDNEPVLKWTGYWGGPRKTTDAFAEQFVEMAPSN